MDPQNPDSFNHRTVSLATGHTYHFVDQTPSKFDSGNPEATRTLLCAHGFPDLWYGWRYQIKPWVEQGYRVVVPDMLGYGGTDKPVDVHQYTTKSLSDDLAALLDYLGLSTAVIIGHDWGCYTIGRFALWHPERVSSMIMLSVPYTPPTLKYMSLDDVVRRFEDFSYQLYLADERSTSEISDNMEVFFRLVFSRPVPNFGKKGVMQGYVRNETLLDPQSPCFLTDEELRYYVSQSKMGMHGPLSYYRTSRARFDEERQLFKLRSTSGPPVPFPAHFPVLLLWGTEDLTCAQFLIKKARDEEIPHMKDHALQGKGHWLMLEGRDVITKKVLDWLSENQPPKQRL